jgi:phage/plasmid-like protein (TIGR03299 family)
MSHDIEITTHGASFVYGNGKKPGWHGLGAMAAESDTIEDMQVKAGHLPVAGQSMFLADGTKVEGWKAIVRADGKQIATMRDSYEITQAARLWDLMIRPFMASGRVNLECAGSLDNGAKIWACAQIPSLAKDITGKGDIVLPYVSFASSYNGKLPNMAFFHDGRVECANTLRIALDSDATRLVSVKHTKNSPAKLETVAASLDLEARDFTANVKAYQAMAATRFNASMLDSYIRAVFTPEKSGDDDAAKRLIKAIEPLVIWSGTDLAAAQDRLLDMAGLPSAGTEIGAGADIIDRAYEATMEILETPNRVGGVSNMARGTVWDAYNATTEYLSHVRGRSAETRMDALFFGPAAAQSARAFDVAHAMARGAPLPR